MLRDDLSAPFARDDRPAVSGSVSAVRQSAIRKKAASGSKRLFDILLTLAALPIILPFMAIVSLFLSVRVGGPIFYVHKRIGKDGREFGCIKFRTMMVDADNLLQRHLAENPAAKEEWERTQKLLNDPRIIPIVGQTLRNTSLDELPQLINVLKGEMSLVGPRPVTAEELERYGSDATFYKAVRPGITGKWQVSGRSETCYSERIKLDVEYVQTQSLIGDLTILAKTVIVVLKKEGAA